MADSIMDYHFVQQEVGPKLGFALDSVSVSDSVLQLYKRDLGCGGKNTTTQGAIQHTALQQRIKVGRVADKLFRRQNATQEQARPQKENHRSGKNFTGLFCDPSGTHRSLALMHLHPHQVPPWTATILQLGSSILMHPFP